MKPLPLLSLALVTLLLTACGGGSGGSAPFTGASTEFVPFVKDLLGQTADTTDPVETNDLTFVGTEVEDETAFDDVLANPPSPSPKPDARR